jgi:hypothetical protein
MFNWIPSPIGIITTAFSWGLDKLKSAGADLIKEAFQWICGMLLSGVAWLFMVIWRFLAEATTPNLYASWFTGGPYAVMRTLASGILMLALLLAIGEAVWNRSGQGVLRALVHDFPKAVFLLTTLLFITTLGLGLADAVSAWLMGMFSGSANDFAATMSNVTGKLQFGAGLAVVILTALVMLLVLLAVAIGFMFREGFIFFLVAITVVMVCLDVYRPTKGAGGQSMRLLAGVIVAKPLIALCFALGGAMLGAAATDSPPDAGAVAEPGTAATAAADPTADPAMASAIGENADDLPRTFGVLLAGMATMMLAAVAPLTVLKLVPAAAGAGSVHEAQQEVTAKVTAAASNAAAAL